MLRSRRCLQGWTKLDPGKTRPPLAWPLIALIVQTLLKAKEKRAAAAIMLMFVGYLRPGEATHLLEEDLVKPGRGQKHYTLNLRPAEREEMSKVGLSDETIILDSKQIPQLGTFLQKLRTGQPKRLLFQLEASALKRLWEETLETIGLARTHAVLYQLRHSGPSHDRLMRFRSLEEVKKKGRWGSDSSVKRYEAHALVNQHFQRLPTQTQTQALEAAKTFNKVVPRYFSQTAR